MIWYVKDSPDLKAKFFTAQLLAPLKNSRKVILENMKTVNALIAQKYVSLRAIRDPLKHWFLYLFLAFFTLAGTQVSAQSKSVDSLLKALDAAPDKEKVKIYLKLSSEVNQNRPTRAVFYSKEALIIAQHLKNDTLIGNALHSAGTAYIYLPDYDEAVTYLDSALAIREKLNDTLGSAKTLNNLGLAYFNVGEVRTAIEHYKRSYDKRKETSDKKGASNTLMNIGLCFRTIGEFSTAMIYFSEALQMAELLKDRDLTASAYQNIAILFSDQKRYEKALDYHLIALKVKREGGNKKAIANAMGNVGTTYQNLKKYDKALQYQLEALKLREEINDKKGIGTTSNNIAELFIDLEEYKKAQQYCEKSLAIREEINDRTGVASALANLARVFEKLGRIQDAINTLEKSTREFELLESNTLLTSNYRNLALLYSQQNNFKKAFENQLKYSNLNDSLFQESSFRQIAELQTKYESEKKEKEIELLNKENEIKEQRNKKTTSLLYAICIGALIVGYVIYNRYQFKQKANRKLELAYSEIEAKNKDITDSIVYAKRIQDAILPSSEQLKASLPYGFVLFKPKDIVSGDFYWAEVIESISGDRIFIFSAVDCTGHGVPGAFLSMVGSSLLTQTVYERGITTPSKILDDLNVSLKGLLIKGRQGEEVKDGMDIAVCSFNDKTGELQYAAAFNPMFIVRRGSAGELRLEEIKANKQSIGITDDTAIVPFTNNTLHLNKGDCVYIFTDGFADQFGGPEGKKYKYNQFKELLLSVNTLTPGEQKQKIEESFVTWKGEFEQVDDVLVIGLKYT
jgi:tetratricopeptide (TPR) repeat protein/serine phosphatase RsbU (regulator of sigma subunit)